MRGKDKLRSLAWDSGTGSPRGLWEALLSFHASLGFFFFNGKKREWAVRDNSFKHLFALCGAGFSV